MIDPKQRAIDLHTEQAPWFDEHYQRLENDPYGSCFTYGRVQIEELIEREVVQLDRGARILDIGCGTGFNIARLRARGLDAAGVEPSEGMRSRARRNNPDADIRAADGDALPFDDGSFDLVLSIEVVRYLADPSRALAEMRRVLRPGGRAFITAAPLLSLNGYAVLNEITSRVAVPTFSKIRHTFHTERSLHAAVREAGFGSCEVHGRFLGPWQAVERVSPTLLRGLLRALEPMDRAIADRAGVRDLSNHLIAIATK